jgi:hypothetical protein
MTILLNKTTKDSDLSKGLQVCYQDLNGAFTKLGVITDTFQQDGITLYLINTAMGAYAASELKLIAPKQLNSCKVHFDDSQYDYETSLSADTTEITAMQYFVGKQFNVGSYPQEIMKTCKGITFTDNNNGKDENKKYWVCGPRSAWDQVLIGLFDSKAEAEAAFPEYPKCVREATAKEIEQHATN